jgi:hypothetical protein
LDPYAGAALTVGMIGKGKSALKDATTTSTNVTTVDATYEIKGGMAFGVNLILGFNYFFSEKIALGAEASWGFNSSTFGGEYSGTRTTTTTSPATTTSKPTKGIVKSGFSGFSVGSTAGITLSYFFQ